MPRSSSKPVVKSFVGKPKKKSFLNFKSPKDIGIAIAGLVAVAIIGNGVIGTLNAGLGNTGQARKNREALDNFKAASAEVKEEEPAPSEPEKNWYDGGTLHKAGALEWQQATYANKLATCGDFVAALWQGEKLKPELQAKIKNMDQIRVLAELLVKSMDKAMAPLPDPEENRKVYQNQTVRDMAVYAIALSGFTE